MSAISDTALRHGREDLQDLQDLGLEVAAQASEVSLIDGKIAAIEHTKAILLALDAPGLDAPQMPHSPELETGRNGR